MHRKHIIKQTSFECFCCNANMKQQSLSFICQFDMAYMDWSNEGLNSGYCVIETKIHGKKKVSDGFTNLLQTVTKLNSGEC